MFLRLEFLLQSLSPRLIANTVSRLNLQRELSYDMRLESPFDAATMGYLN